MRKEKAHVKWIQRNRAGLFFNTVIWVHNRRDLLVERSKPLALAKMAMKTHASNPTNGHLQLILLLLLQCSQHTYCSMNNHSSCTFSNIPSTADNGFGFAQSRSSERACISHHRCVLHGSWQEAAAEAKGNVKGQWEQRRYVFDNPFITLYLWSLFSLLKFSQLFHFFQLLH